MATKTAAKKKTTYVKKSPAKKASKSSLPIGIYKENNPGDHVATGKYKFFFVLFAVAMVLFAAISVWLFVFSSQLLDKYQSIETCARNGETCEVKVKDNGDVEPTTNE